MNTNTHESSTPTKGWKLVNFCEFDKYASTSYCAIHNVDESLNLGDINEVDENNLQSFNMICGGSPCQDFSIAGEQKGSVWTCNDCGHEYNPLMVHWSKRDKCPCCDSENIEKTRSSLLVEYLRVIRGNKPNFGIYENVKNIISKKFRDMKKNYKNMGITHIGKSLILKIMVFRKIESVYIYCLLRRNWIMVNLSFQKDLITVFV